MITVEKSANAEQAWKFFRKSNNVPTDEAMEKFGIDHEQVKKLAILAAIGVRDSFVQAFESMKM